MQDAADERLNPNRLANIRKKRKNLHNYIQLKLHSDEWCAPMRHPAAATLPTTARHSAPQLCVATLRRGAGTGSRLRSGCRWFYLFWVWFLMSAIVITLAIRHNVVYGWCAPPAAPCHPEVMYCPPMPI